MASRKLVRVKALSSSAEQCTKLKSRGITSCQEFLSAHELELMAILSLTYYQLQSLIHAVSQAVAPHPKNPGSGPAVNGGFIPTHLPTLDSALHGGLPRGTITEVAGSAGSGKTQLCLTLTMTTSLPISSGGCGLGVVYIDTEATFSAERLVELARARHMTEPDIKQLASRVRVHRALTCSELEERLQALEAELAELGEGAGLVVVDSVASPVRREFGTETGREAMERAAELGELTARLKYLAEAFDIAVVVTNQITTTGISHDMERESDWSVSGGSHVTAALGNTWAHCVNTRLLLGHLPHPHRILTIEKSPVSDCQTFVVAIEERGVVLDPTVNANVDLQGAGPGLNYALQVRSDVDVSMN